MKLLRLKDLHDTTEGHFLKGLIPGQHLNQGGMNFKKPGHRSHDTGCPCPACDDKGNHIHADDCEVFVILQGKAVMQCAGKEYNLKTGDIFVAEPGEDHHLVADENDPCVNLFLHAGPERNSDQII